MAPQSRRRNLHTQFATTKKTRIYTPANIKHAIGGYGLFGVVLSADIETIENVSGRMAVKLVSEKDFPREFEKHAKDPGVKIAYGRLSPTLDGEALVHVFREESRKSAASQPPAGKASFNPEDQHVDQISRFVLWASKQHRALLAMRWNLEKKLQVRPPGKEATGSLVSFMNLTAETLRPYAFEEGRRADILHEYFIPKENYQQFVDGLRRIQNKNDMHTLNVTIRDVLQDTESVFVTD